MKNKHIQIIRQQLDELGLIEHDPAVVGFVMFNTQKKSFLSVNYNLKSALPEYTGNIEYAYIIDNKVMGRMVSENLPEPDKFDIAIVPVIKTMFGLSVKPGALDKISKPA